MAAPKRPLPDIAALEANPHAPVLIVTTPDARRAAAAFVPDGCIAITWEGGVTRTDWSPINGRPVAIWRDAGLDGARVAHTLGATLRGRARLIDPPPEAPDGWNLCGPIPEGLDVPYIIARALEPLPEPPTPAPPANETPDDGPAPPPPVAKYRALGYKDGRFFFFSSRTNNIHDFNSKDLRSGNGLRDLEPDDIFWARQPQRGPTTANLDWKYLGDQAIAQCYAVGVYNEAKIRARGVWLDASSPHTAGDPTPIVAHLGDTILIDGVPSPSMGIDSRYIYPVDEPLLPDAPPDTPALTDDEGSDLRYLCRYLPWVNNTSGDLLAGLIATSCICGALQFRTHGWITGPAGGGKSWVMENIVARALDGIGLHILGNSTEAGIRRHLSRDARPAIYDEAEGEGIAGKQRRDMIIAFMRASSTETKAKILLGSGGPTGESFPVRAQFILSSVGTALDRATDNTRCLLLTLRGRTAATERQRQDFAAHFAEIQEKVAALPSHLSTRLLRRMIGLVHIVRTNAELFRRLIAAKYASSRIGDQLGGVLAGVYALEHATKCDEPTAEKFLATFPWDDYVTSTDATGADEGDLFATLLAHQTRVEAKRQVVTRTVGELCIIATGSNALNDEYVFRLDAQKTLSRLGIVYDFNHDGFWLSTTSSALASIFSGSQFPQGYNGILQRVVGAKKSKSSVYFASGKARATLIPAKLMAPADAQAERASDAESAAD